MVSTCLLISKSSSPCTNPLVSVLRAPIITDITVTFMFHSFFNSLARLSYLSLFLFSFSLTLWSTGTAKSTIWHIIFFLSTITRSGCLTEIKWSFCISKIPEKFCVSFSRTDSGLWIYHLFVWSNFNFLHKSLWITLSTQSYLVLYSFCANLLHSLIMWLIVSSLSPHNLHLLFCCVLFILALIWLVLMVLFWAAVRGDSVSQLRFPFFSHVPVFSLEMSLVSHLKHP